MEDFWIAYWEEVNNSSENPRNNRSIQISSLPPMCVVCHNRSVLETKIYRYKNPRHKTWSQRQFTFCEEHERDYIEGVQQSDKTTKITIKAEPKRLHFSHTSRDIDMPLQLIATCRRVLSDPECPNCPEDREYIKNAMIQIMEDCRQISEIVKSRENECTA